MHELVWDILSFAFQGWFVLLALAAICLTFVGVFCLIYQVAEQAFYIVEAKLRDKLKSIFKHVPED